MFRKMGDSLRRFMYGRYGSDQLSGFLLALGIALCLLGSIPSLYFLGIVAYVPLVLAIFRMYSRRIEKRRKENQRFLQLFLPFRDRERRYFKCPRCGQRVRVPRNKGKVAIRCPACAERFTKKT